MDIGRLDELTEAYILHPPRQRRAKPYAIAGSRYVTLQANSVACAVEQQGRPSRTCVRVFSGLEYSVCNQCLEIASARGNTGGPVALQHNWPACEKRRYEH